MISDCFEIHGKYASAKVFASNVEDGCISQLNAMCNHPAFDLRETGDHIAIMPDVHQGKGSVIGFTMPLQSRVIANVIGVDIGCGVLGARFRPRKHFELAHLDKVIRERIPLGFNTHDDPCPHGFCMDSGEAFWDRVTSVQLRLWRNLKTTRPDAPKPPDVDASHYEELCKRIGMNFARAQASIGTLGGGNHFIELGKVEGSDYHWMIIHCGSRQLGERVCRYWQKMATQRRKDKLTPEYEKEVACIRYETKPRSRIPKEIGKLRERLGINDMKGSTLDYLEGDDFYGYLWDMVFAQAYAENNRRCIMRDCLKVLKVDNDSVVVIDTVHNYIDFDDLVIRKGAIRVHKGEKVILPFNMRDGTLICEGLGNEDWNRSAPHGAGRLFSRSHAKQVLSLSAARKQMDGIYTSEIPLDESPGAYKPAEVIEKAIGPTAKIIERVKPVLNIKAG